MVVVVEVRGAAEVPAGLAVQTVGVAQNAGRVAFQALVARYLLVEAFPALQSADVQVQVLIVHLGGVVGVRPALGALLQRLPEAQAAARVAELAEPGGLVGVVAVGAHSQTLERVVEVVVPAGTLQGGGAVVQRPHTAPALHRAVLALVVVRARDKLAVWALRIALAHTQHLVVGSRAIRVLCAGMALQQRRPVASRTPRRTVLTRRVVGVLVLTVRAVLHAQVVLQEHIGA